MELPTDKLAFTVPEWIASTGQSRSDTYEAFRTGALRAKKRGKRTIILRVDGVDYLNRLPDYQPDTEAA